MIDDGRSAWKWRGPFSEEMLEGGGFLGESRLEKCDVLRVRGMVNEVSRKFSGLGQGNWGTMAFLGQVR